MRVVGTAGHVDHGKSTLVAALTGTHPDRLKEEQAREMTIDLGFAWLTLPGGEEIGIVDVPGHRDFIENMLSGVGGIDAALFVVAADEGVMPQTREHLAILDLLQIQGGVVALTKIDLLPDPEWLEMVEDDLQRVFRGTVLEGAPVVRVSARSGEGLETLKACLAECLAGRPPRLDLGRARLPVDRVFTIAGFGTVVTGTLLDGSLHGGEDVEILPAGFRGRVRGLQSHKRKEDTALPGSRTAVNISGVDVSQVRRGDVVAAPGKYRPSGRLDVFFRLLDGASAPLRHGTEVKLFLGASEVMARTRLLGGEQLDPGQEGWLQLDLVEPLVAVRGDRYILRRPSPGETLGGGSVMDPHPKGRHRRFDEVVLQRLEAFRQGAPEDVLHQASMALGVAPLREVALRSRLSEEQFEAALQILLQDGRLLLIDEGKPSFTCDLLTAAFETWQELSGRALRELDLFHKTNPLRRGMPREELKSRLKLPPRVFTATMRRWCSEGQVMDLETLAANPGHTVRFTATQQASIKALMARFQASPWSPPTVKECQVEVGEEVYFALIDLGDLVPVSAEVVYRKADYAALLESVVRRMEKEGELTVAQFRDQFNTSRRYALAFLEHLDAVGITQRDGDKRVLRRKGRG